MFGPTAFLAAAQTADVDFMKTLIDLGADPLLTDEDNSTALMLAGARTGTEGEVLQTIELLLDLGVDIDAVDDNGETAMHAAAYNDRPEPIKLLAAKGASIEVWNRKNKLGSTPLAIAVGYRGPRSFRPQPNAEAAIREVMIAAGVDPPKKVTVYYQGGAGPLGFQATDTLLPPETSNRLTKEITESLDTTLNYRNCTDVGMSRTEQQ